jgi:glycine cleavage system aminomethyltransferase T
VALALLEDGASRHGEQVQVTSATADGLALRSATVVVPVFVDPEGGRMRG